MNKPAQIGIKRFMANKKSVAPNVLARSALFSVLKKGERKQVGYKEVASTPECKIVYSGWELDQADFDVWIELLRRTHNQLFSEMEEGKEYVIETTYKEFLLSIGRGTGGSSIAWLKESLRRLQYHSLAIEGKKFMYAGALISGWLRSEDDTTLGVRLNPDLAKLFLQGYAVFLSETKYSLKGDLTKWLYIYTRTQTKNKCIKIGLDKLKELSGYSSATKYFKRDITKSLERLTNENLIKFFSIDKNKTLVIQLE